MNDWDKKPLLRTAEEAHRPVRLSILGNFELNHADGRQFSIATKKNRALLAILALSPGFQATRERLCGLLWGDRGEDQARSSLRQSLAVLRKELGGVEDLVLRTHDDIVALRGDTVQMDAVEFLALSNNSEITALREAAKLYRGELLNDTSIRDAAFEDWLSAERSRLRTVAIEIFDRLVPLEEGHAQITVAQQLVSLDSLRESSHRLLMQAYADQGDNGLALKQFELCRKLLHEELSVEPARETLELRRQIAEGERKPTKQENIRTEPTKVLQAVQLPSIAVLPLLNLSGDPQQDYFAEGIAEDIITELGRFSTLLVIGRNSSFRYRGRSLDVIAVGKELGVSYLVSGSVRRIGEKVRISAQLVDAKSGNHLWSERYDHALGKIFDVQDDVVRAVVATTEHRIADTETDGIRSKPPADLVAYDCFLRARQLMEYFDRHLEAESYLKRATELEPDFSEPYSLLAHLEIYKYFMDGKAAHIVIAGDLAQQSLACDDRSSNAHDAIGFVSCFTRDYDFARFHFDRALALNPNNIRALSNSAAHLTWIGKYQDALRRLDIILARDPFPPNWYWDIRGAVLFQLRRYPEAIEAYNNVVDKQFWEYAYVIAALAHSGKENRAVAQVSELERRHPGTTIARIMQVEVYADEAGRQHLVGGLRLAGLPEELPAKQTSSGKPAIAVLSFANLSGDPQQNYFAIGVSDNLVLALSRFREIRVLRADAFHDTSQLQRPAEGNGLTKQADFILSGSIQKNGDRIRITVQLRSTRSSQVCWTDQYDRHTHDIFAIQDEIVEAFAYNIVNKINTEMLQALKASRTENFSAYELFIQGRSNAYKQSEETNLLAAQLLQNAIQLDSNFAAAHAWLAETIWVAWWAGWRDDKSTALSAALNHARRAVEFDNGDPHGFAELGQAYLYQGEFGLAQGALERSLFLNPHNPDAMIIYSFYWLYMGDAEKAHSTIQSAIRRDPNGHYGVVLGIISYILGRWEESIAALRHVRAKFHSVDAWLAAALAMNGDQIAAQVAASQYLANRSPSMHVGEATAFILARNPFKAQKDIELVRDGLTKAGL